jgi:trans-aconitate methyltransferase
MNAKQRWNSELYDSKHGFVSQLGSDLVELLAPKKGEHILDLGCGTGHLAQQIAAHGARVTGLDSSAEMIERARLNYPDLELVQGNGADFAFDEPFDAVFSNAALHWIHAADDVVRCVWQALRPGGRFIAEFGGKDNVRAILAAYYASLSAAGHSLPEQEPWYFPSLGEYATVLEKQGFRVVYAVHFDRPTPLEGEDGMRNWLAMFGNHLLSVIPESERDVFIADAERRMRPTLYQNGKWYADYRRLRVVAQRENEV